MGGGGASPFPSCFRHHSDGSLAHMQPLTSRLVAGHHPPHPKWVWSPAGGWQWQDVWQPGLQGAQNKNWVRNTAMATVAAGLMLACVFQKSRSLEEKPQAPYRKIPSIHWFGRKELRDMYPDPKIPGA